MNNRDGEYSRREFMTKPLTYLAGAGLATVASRMCSGIETAADRTPTRRLIERPLGKTGITLPIVSMGVMNAEAPGLIVRSYEAGIRHFDTAAVYQGGRNEEMVGNMIRQLGVRDKVLIATKAGVHRLGEREPAETKAEMLGIFEGSLKRLQMDHVEILYSHGLDTAGAVDDRGIQQAMTQLKKAGRIRFAGVSTHRGQTEVLNAVARSGFYDVVLVAFNYTMSDNQALIDAMKLCASKGIGLVAMKTQGGGRGPKQPDVFASDAQKSVRQSAVLKWVMQHPFITTAVPGFTQFEQIDEVMPVALNIEFSREEKNFVANNSIKASLEFCQQCGDCVVSCPKRVDIPTLMRSHMYAFQYANLDHARFTLAEFGKGEGLDICGSCTECAAMCTHTVNIRRKIGELRTLHLA